MSRRNPQISDDARLHKALRAAEGNRRKAERWRSFAAGLTGEPRRLAERWVRIEEFNEARNLALADRLVDPEIQVGATEARGQSTDLTALLGIVKCDHCGRTTDGGRVCWRCAADDDRERP